nr:MAG TPA: hypothetical protein [Bacteriophage sp.]
MGIKFYSCLGRCGKNNKGGVMSSAKIFRFGALDDKYSVQCKQNF